MSDSILYTHAVEGKVGQQSKQSKVTFVRPQPKAIFA